MKISIIYKIFNEMQMKVSEKCLSDEKYLSAKKESYNIENELTTELPDDQKEKLNNYIDTLTTIGFIECKYNFYYGFKIGVSLILEVLNKQLF